MPTTLTVKITYTPAYYTQERNPRAVQLLDIVARWLDETNHEVGPDRDPLTFDLTKLTEA